MTTQARASDNQILMAAIGCVMLHWCYLEDELAETIRQMRIESEGGATLIRVRGSFSDRLSEWRGLLSQKTRRNPQLAEAVAEQANEMEHLRAMRNLIAHSLAGASASPEEEEAYIWCAERGASIASGEPNRITLSELRAMVEAMDRCRERFRMIAR